MGTGGLIAFFLAGGAVGFISRRLASHWFARPGGGAYRYALSGGAAAFSFAGAAEVIGWRPELAVCLFLLAVLAVVVQTDLADMIIPDAVVAAGAAGLLLLRIWSHPLPYWNYVAAAFVGSGILLLIGIVGERLLKKEAMGGGDVKLYVCIGLALGIKLTLLSLFAASVVGLAAGLIEIAAGSRERGNHLPFGPWIALGAMLVYLWGGRALDWYFDLQFLFNK